MLNFITKSFSELTATELYEILRLRSQVFVVEQKCIYQDVDNKDQKALHIFGSKNNRIIAYARIFKPNDYFEKASIGRIVVVASERKFGYGQHLIKASIAAIKNNFKTNNISISAQIYLKKLYESLDFQQVGEEYLEDGIPHIRMDKY